MFISSKKKILSFSILLFMLALLFSGCGTNIDNKNTSISNSSSFNNEDTNNTQNSLNEQKLTWELSDNPIIDPSLNLSDSGFTVIRALYQGLTTLNDEGNVIPGVAENLPSVSTDGLNYKFKINKGAKWSDGKSVSSNDFVYSIKRALTLKKSPHVSELFNIKNAKAYYDNLVSFDEVGIKALGDLDLEITLNSPVPYFLELLTNEIFMPLREDIISKVNEENDSWTYDPKTCITNGPFKLKEWTKDSLLVVSRNEEFLNSKNIKLEDITFKIIKDENAAISSFINDEIDFIKNPPISSISELTDKKAYKAFPFIGTYFLTINQSSEIEKIDPESAKVLKDVRIRKALSLAIDRQSIIDAITMSGKPALAYVPYGVKDDKNEEFNDKKYINDNDIETAKALMMDAGYPNGKNFPTLKYIYNDDPNNLNKKIATAIQSMWRDNLGITLEIKGEDPATFKIEKDSKQFVIINDTQIGDYMDANTFLSKFYSKNEEDDVSYSNPIYDEKLEASFIELNSANRIKLLKDCESILLEDSPIIPIFFYAIPVAVKPYVKNVSILANGAVYFDNIYIDKTN
ncbi:MAG: peptide ABC transporter substrate-binding protein [Oscillospiraceae bacterium]|nr:peptide ABC transporter substrate-binding protein [Oscillospiraceae bacterium]